MSTVLGKQWGYDSLRYIEKITQNVVGVLVYLYSQRLDSHVKCNT